MPYCIYFMNFKDSVCEFYKATVDWLYYWWNYVKLCFKYFIEIKWISNNFCFCNDKKLPKKLWIQLPSSWADTRDYEEKFCELLAIHSNGLSHCIRW
jgi:hypothetical protein